MGAVPWLRQLAASLLLPIVVRANHDTASQNGYNTSDFNETMAQPDGTCNVDAAVGPLNPDAFHVCGSVSAITCHSIYVSGGVGSSQGAIERARCGFTDFFAPECCRTGGYETYDPSNSAHVSSFDANQVSLVLTDDGSWYRDDFGTGKPFISHCEAGGADAYTHATINQPPEAWPSPSKTDACDESDTSTGNNCCGELKRYTCLESLCSRCCLFVSPASPPPRPLPFYDQCHSGGSLCLAPDGKHLYAS